MKRVILGVTSAALTLAATAIAQPAAPDPSTVRARIARELACVAGAEADLSQWRRLLADARAQLEAPTTSEPMRREAAEAVVVLEGRVRETAEALLACMPAADPAGAVAGDEPSDPVAPELAAISVHLRAGPPVSEGAGGRVDAAAVHRALLPFGREFDVCYEALAARHAIVRGTATLRFVVRGDGSVHGLRLDGLTLGDPTFQRCAAQAATRVGSPGRPAGGDARVQVALHLGPEG